MFCYSTYDFSNGILNNRKYFWFLTKNSVFISVGVRVFNIVYYKFIKRLKAFK